MLLMPPLRWAFAGVLMVAAAAAQAPALEEAIAVEGRVVDMLGDGVPAAQVWVVDPRFADERLAGASTDGDGIFRLPRVPTRTVLHLHATAPGHCVGTAELQPDTPALVRLQHATTVTGVLRNHSGAPVANVVVRADVCSRALSEVASLATTDENGRFEMRDAPLGPLRVRAWVPREGVAEVFADVCAPTQVVLQVPEEPSTTLSIHVRNLPADSAGDVFIDLRTTDARGESRLPPPYTFPRYEVVGTHLLQIPHCAYRGVVRSRAGQFRETLHPGSPWTTRWQVSAMLESGDVLLRATIVDEAGRPVPDVRFALGHAGRETVRSTTTRDGKLTLTGSFATLDTMPLRSLDARWAIAEQLRGELPPLPSRNGVQDVLLDPDTPVTLRLHATCTLRGRVLAPDGRPAQLVPVRFAVHDESDLRHRHSYLDTITDLRGDFELRPMPRTSPCSVASSSPMGHAMSELFELRRPGPPQVLAPMRLEAPAVVAGVVVDDAKRPAAGTRVWLLCGDLAGGVSHTHETITDRTGRFRFHAVPPGRALVQLPASDSWDVRTDAFEIEAVTAGRTHAVTVQRPAR